MKQCEQCNRQFPDHMVFCPFDGDILEAEVEDLLIGRVIDGKYRLEEKLGEGGMGTVYKAKHVLIQNELAVKVLHSSLVADRHAVARFQREATAAARIKHPNAVGVTDFGRTEDEIVYIVMELFVGQSLRDIIENQGPMPIERTVNIIRQVCLALDAAHRSGVIHRDIKPDNIVIEQGPQGDLVKVLDFGIAKLKDGPSGESGGRLTRQGVIIGSPHYLSPEQCQNAELDARSDIYSLGIVLYEMFTADVPFKAPTPIAVAMMHATETPAPVTEKRPDLPKSLELLIMRALEKDPNQRQQSALDLAQDLDRACLEIGITVLPLPGVPSLSLPPNGEGSTDYPPRQNTSTNLAKANVRVPAPEEESGTNGNGNNKSGGSAGLRKSDSFPKFSTTGSMAPESALPKSGRLDQRSETPSFISRTSPLPPTTASLGNPSATLLKFGQLDQPEVKSSGKGPLIGIAVVIVAAVVLVGGYLIFFRTNPATTTQTPKGDPVISVPAGMIYIKGGTFKMGINQDQADKSDRYVSPQREVTIKAFYIDKTEITNQDYKKFIDATKQPAPYYWKDNQFPPGTDLQPVTNVNWSEANAYAQWAGKRLPSEMEWEYAARGADARAYPWGKQWQEGLAISKESSNTTQPVGSLPKGASPFGVLDMAGNVWEWTADTFAPYPGNEEPVDPRLKDSKVIRGGSFKAEKKFLTTYFRNMVKPDFSDTTLGFRCVKSAE